MIEEVVTVPTVFVADTVNVYDPAAEGVPESEPFDASVRPGGSDPLARANVIGAVPDAANV